MNKQKHEVADAEQANADTNPGQLIVATMERPEFTPEQLPELWQQAVKPIVAVAGKLGDRINAWNAGLEAMYGRCETYPQHIALELVLSELPRAAWHNEKPYWITKQVNVLLRQATQEQLLAALTIDRQHQPNNRVSASRHIAAWAAVEKLTEQIVRQLKWSDEMASWLADEPYSDSGQWRHVNDIIRQLLGDDNDAWTMFLGIVEPGNTIGDVAELVGVIEPQKAANPLQK